MDRFSGGCLCGNVRIVASGRSRAKHDTTAGGFSVPAAAAVSAQGAIGRIGMGITVQAMKLNDYAETDSRA